MSPLARLLLHELTLLRPARRQRPFFARLEAPSPLGFTPGSHSAGTARLDHGSGAPTPGFSRHDCLSSCSCKRMAEEPCTRYVARLGLPLYALTPCSNSPGRSGAPPDFRCTAPDLPDGRRESPSRCLPTALIFRRTSSIEWCWRLL